ncbi:23S rRNA (guanosine2251-2'-O)-methyltransferase [Thermotomaculum hydrothermale]|uniref:23S rRNA (Guanosine2251-2'-O)-methyltransferase n=1 Tax=Thermotomaculum hydrothermale TaxID=981385 RepID=A0A7R6SYT6_9BACT|nr:RNA methyltransferase [Thermotomaculum hydrothermale]BBB32160.1 23S rRNA (guanosine2251-2'-O)-methyltransferase [Thermotomaculum hydrothermale]
MIIYGVNAVKECVKANKKNIEYIYFSRKKLGFEVRGIPVIRKDKNILTKIAKTNEHQGVIAKLKSFEYAKLESVISDKENINLVYLDRVNDPHNLGAAIRVCECAGIDALIIGEKFGAKVSPAVFKTSTGAVCYLPVCLSENIGEDIEFLRRNGFSLYSVENTENAINLNEFTLKTDKNLFIFGSEGEGISKDILKKSTVITIPMKGKINSLNLSTSVAAFLFRVLI